MTESGDQYDAMLADLEKAFMKDAEPIATQSGQAWLGSVALYTFAEERCPEPEDLDCDPSEIVDVLAWDGSVALLCLAVRNPGPPDWDWSLRAKQIGQRGYIWMMHEDANDDPCLPMFAAWEPYDNQQAFEAAFIAGHSDKLWEFIGVGTHYERSVHVSADLWERALRKALDDNDCWQSLPVDGPTDTPEQREALLRRYLTEREGI